MRLFLAINLPLADRKAIHAAATPLRAVSDAISWVPADRLHLTLKFLGEQRDDEHARIAAALGGVVSRHRTFAVDMSGVGAFPNFRKPHIVWIGVTDDPKLELLHNDVEAACADLGHEVDGRAFRAHLTLGRVRRPIPAEEARALAAAARAVRYRGTMVVQSVDVMQSEMGKGGSRYTVRSALPLRGDA
ncbi:MAG TPA: RNA 2',3'-cyclic phosphodiesterase [Gemmatimonadaceae bacterium]|nr:RNA 2',3'-cyclic phosphodiesterase [Gemmatimonadaceae bacterium]